MGRPSNKQTAAAKEIGGNFTDMYGGVLGVSTGGRLSYLPELAGMNLLAELEKMWFLDETAGAMGFCIQTALSQAAWNHVPQVDGVDAVSDTQAKAAAAFADSWLLDMEAGFQDHVEDAVMMLPYGYAACEIVAKVRDRENSRFSDGKWGIKRLPMRDPFTIWSWIYEDKSPVGFQQTGLASGVTPLWKTLHYRMSHNMGRPTGRSFLLNVLRVWRLKQKVQDTEAIGIERELAGMPIARVPQEVMDVANDLDAQGQPTADALKARAQIERMTTAVSQLRFNRSGGIVLSSEVYGSDDGVTSGKPKWDYSILQSGGQRSIDTRTVVRDYDRAIARVLMMQFLHLGERSTGSFALSSDQSDMSVKALMAIARKIADEWNRKVMPLMFELNGMDKKYMPRLRATNINKDGIEQLAKYFAGISRGKDLWGPDARLRSAMLRETNLDFDPELQTEAAELAAEQAKNPPQATFGAPGQPGQPAADPEDEPEEAERTIQ